MMVRSRAVHSQRRGTFLPQMWHDRRGDFQWLWAAGRGLCGWSSCGQALALLGAQGAMSLHLGAVLKAVLPLERVNLE